MHHLTQEETDILTGIIKKMTEGEFLGKEEECEMFKRHLGEFCFIFGKGIELGKSQLQPPVISATDFLKEKGIETNPSFDGGYRNPKMYKLVDLLTAYLQRQGQKTVMLQDFLKKWYDILGEYVSVDVLDDFETDLANIQIIVEANKHKDPIPPQPNI